VTQGVAFYDEGRLANAAVSLLLSRTGGKGAIEMDEKLLKLRRQLHTKTMEIEASWRNRRA
jgi:hypothetical protein